MIQRIATVLSLLLLFAVPAWAIDFTVSASIVTATYMEPTTNADTPPTALTDLARTNVYFQIAGQPAVRGPNVPASALTGGGAITTTVTIPIGPNQQGDVTFWATATDLSGNESVPSVSVVRRIDRLAPGSPQ